jgi:membrane protein involved in colicin uptake
LSDHPSVEHHIAAAEQLREAADFHDAAVEAHRDNNHDEAAKHAASAKQAVLEAALKSDTAANLSAAKTGA